MEIQYTTERVFTTTEATSKLLALRADGYWSFRGHRNHQWGVGPHHMPKAKHDTHDPEKDLHDLLEALRLQFVKRCKEFKDFQLDERDYWQSVFYAQHYGLKTRLLDWTSNPLVALYFAVENVLSSEDDDKTHGCVWAIKVPANKWFNFSSLPGYGGREEKKWQLAHWVMINPPLMTDRVIRQSGKFSYHPSRDDDDISSLPRAAGEHMIKVIIGDDMNNPTRKIRQELGILNVHHASLFPDFGGVAQFLNKQWPDL